MIKYIEVATQKWDRWLVKIDDEEFPNRESQEEAAFDAVSEEIEYDEAEAQSFNFTSHNPNETPEQCFARHEGRANIIDWTNPDDTEEE